MWKIKNKEAVSPVIGVILMVAITVVLAAVLYVWVSGFMTAGGGGAAPTAALGTPTLVGTNYTVKVTSISAKIDEGKVTIFVMKNDVKQWSGGLGSAVTTLVNAASSSSGACYIDNDGDDLLSTNDLIFVHGTLTTPAYTIVAGDVLRLADTSGNTIATVSF